MPRAQQKSFGGDGTLPRPSADNLLTNTTVSNPGIHENMASSATHGLSLQVKSHDHMEDDCRILPKYPADRWSPIVPCFDGQVIQGQSATDPKSTTSREAKISNFLSRISFSRAVGSSDPICEDGGAQRRARKAESARKQKEERDFEDSARTERRRASKERAQQRKEDKRRREAEARSSNAFFGGMSRGFDPNAGLRLSGGISIGKGRSSSGTIHEDGSCSSSEVPLARQARGDTWGVHTGGPSKICGYRGEGVDSTGGGKFSAAANLDD